MASELELMKRRIVIVLEYFDEEGEMPAVYIQRTGDGQFEAITTCYLILNDDVGEAREHTVGVYATRDEALKALWAHRAAVDRADCDWGDLTVH